MLQGPPNKVNGANSGPAIERHGGYHSGPAVAKF